MFNHSNFSLPKVVENLTVKLIVTPDMHRIHHSSIIAEANSTYGFFFSWWDFLFKSYTQAPKTKPQEMEIGDKLFRSPDDQRLDKLLLQPFK